ncbi:hypothetical protein AMC83_CH01953 [Rhizobium phaseoli]|uniref:hypothetical protein n=1 Tax=Rhizobium phaseoli TaxID=396 RepID=UPI0007F08EE3|nr:hypothetical protein [Rhizobium phaseoli]ANL71936.1 hypothetical protein AMC83_CH01953 [Rhizobium phaseoli]
MKFKLALALMMATTAISASAQNLLSYPVSSVSGSAVTPSGSEGSLQYYNGGNLAGTSNVTYVTATNLLGISTTAPMASLHNAGSTMLGLGAYGTSSALAAAQSAAASLGSSGALTTWMRSPMSLSFSNTVGGNMGIGQIHTTGGLPTNQLLGEFQAVGSTASGTIATPRVWGFRTCEAWTASATCLRLEFRNVLPSTTTPVVGLILENNRMALGYTSTIAINPSATLQVSGTTIPGICNSSMTCGTQQEGATCWSTVKKSWAGCNGANSWVVQTSSTSVSASAL